MPEMSAALTAAGTTAATGIAGGALVTLVARRSPPVATALVPVVVVVAMGVGIYTTVSLMFLERDLTVVLAVLAAASPVAVALGLWMSGLTKRLVRRAADEAAARAAQDELDRSRRTLIAGVSHDLRTPLAGIRALAESVEDGVHPHPDQALAQVRNEVDRLDGMVGDLLELSRLQAGLQPTAASAVDLRDVVSDALTSARAVGAAQGVEVDGRDAGPALVTGDARQLGRVVDNLLGNAVRHTPSGGRVTVDLVTEGDGVRLAVTDGCGGIAERDLARVFEPGFQAGDARTPSAARGAGLGLAIVAEVVARHGGTVRAVNVDGGCRFEVTIPS